jgi:aminoglycoside phosphotransferase family enzyme/predicted kinase
LTGPSAVQIDRLATARPQCGDSAVLEALAKPATYGGQEPVAVHETHASWVFVCGERAYKVKKPLALGFLDHSTLARRHAACREEVRINEELAPGIYLGVRAILVTAHGVQLAPEHAAGAVEYAVEMRSFSEGDTLAGLIASGSLASKHITAVARRLAAFHRRAPVMSGGGTHEVLAMWHANVRELATAAARLMQGWPVDLAEGFADAFVRAHEREIEQRRGAGRVRDGHGDLRCEHVLVVPSVRVVDRLEFDPALRRTDVACDLAFLTMDLEALGQTWAAEELVSAYRQHGGDAGSEALLASYAVHCALVRAKVALIAAAERDGAGSAEQLAKARSLWALGERLSWRARAPVAVIVCGPAASGKSTLAAELALRSTLPVVSSDAERKSAAGLAPNERLDPEDYTEQTSRATYERVGRRAELALAHGHGVIVDATCRSRADRALVLRRLHRTGLTSLVVRCTLSLEMALERARNRTHDPGRVSDATPEVVAEQYRSFQALEELPPAGVLELDTGQPVGAQVAEVTRAVDRILARDASSNDRERAVPPQQRLSARGGGSGGA